MLKSFSKLLFCTILLCSVYVYNAEALNVGCADSKVDSLLKEYDVKEMVKTVEAKVVDTDAVLVPEPMNVSLEVEETAKNESVVDYTQEELEMMEYVVEQETHGGSLEHKRIVSYVIINRVKSDLFPNTIKEVLTAEKQFSSITNYYNKVNPPEEITKQAVYEALNGLCEDKSGGALYFYAPRWCGYMSYFENKPFVLEMEGHRFFK